MLRESVLKTLRITSMIMAILLGGTIFTGVFFAAGGIDLTNQAVGYFNLNTWALLALLLGMVFLAGFVLDWISILLIFIPIFMPLVKAAGFNPVWFCILFLIIIQTSYLTPPMAPAIFYLRGIAPPSITLLDMYKGVIPFILLQVVTLAIVMASRRRCCGCRPSCSVSNRRADMTPEQVLSHKPRVLTQKQREHYFAEGYLLLEKIIPDDWVQRLRAATDELIERSRKVTQARRGVGPRARPPRRRAAPAPRVRAGRPASRRTGTTCRSRCSGTSSPTWSAPT